MLAKLLKKRMKQKGFNNYTELSRHANMNPGTIKKALDSGDGKVTVYAKIAEALDCKIKYTLEG